jgi:hypothetical protein
VMPTEPLDAFEYFSRNPFLMRHFPNPLSLSATLLFPRVYALRSASAV